MGTQTPEGDREEYVEVGAMKIGWRYGPETTMIVREEGGALPSTIVQHRAVEYFEVETSPDGVTREKPIVRL